MLRKAKLPVLLYILIFIFTFTSLTTTVSAAGVSSDYSKYQKYLKSQNMSLSYKGIKYNVYKLTKGSGFLYFNEKTGNLVKDSQIAGKLYKLLAFGTCYLSYTNMTKQISNLSPYLLYGKTAVSQIGEAAIKGVLTKNPAAAAKSFLEKQKDPATILTYIKTAWAQIEYKNNILPLATSVYSTSTGVKVQISKGKITVDDNKKDVDKLFNNFIDGFYKWKTFLNTIDEMGLTVDPGVKAVFSETAAIFKDAFSGGVNIKFNNSQFYVKATKLADKIAKYKNNFDLANELKSFVESCGITYYKDYKAASDSFKNMFADIGYINRVTSIDSTIKNNY